MSGRRAKLLRKQQGISIQARREERAFERQIDIAREARAERCVDASRERRAMFAWFALAVVVACVAGALFL